MNGWGSGVVVGEQWNIGSHLVDGEVLGVI